ncbi:MAG TPA: energy transducer TonB [Candidatus Acidoferrum sp.]|nr:energy transducer TonB [Candidatus Acidoferrum sp.]
MAFLTLAAVAQQPTSEAAAAAAAPASASGSAATSPVNIPSYPDSTKGLESFVKEMLKLEKEGNQQELELYEKSLALPDPDGWFKSVFGEELGAEMARVSAPMRADAELHTADMLATQVAEKRTDVEAVRFDDSCNSRATAIEYPFLLLRQRPEHLYDVRFLSSSAGSLWAYFTYVDGGFRFIGNMKKKELGVREAHPPTGSTQRIRLGGNVQAAKLVHQEQPVYPPEAKAAGIQGTVILHAIIAKDGSIRDLYLDEGQCWLAQSAMEAVRKWRYRPTKLNGEPVEVDTTIQVIYTLGG